MSGYFKYTVSDINNHNMAINILIIMDINMRVQCLLKCIFDTHEYSSLNVCVGQIISCIVLCTLIQRSNNKSVNLD